uniref:Uncharacterized protein n=1 Tax=Kwoniella dejecticola CBS 10117 TaxID=1296121 RepID=A0A1A6ABJ9_9TREE|nr:uncharacterized protein I303_01640 [Kwoniella dejecticola CBS 10117]OBR87437.1 hypothetical protein I303_01640 [Kwoniella dejecticola CBS 10117]
MRPFILSRHIASLSTHGHGRVQYLRQNGIREISNLPPPRRKRELNVLAGFQPPFRPKARVPLQDVVGSPSPAQRQDNGDKSQQGQDGKEKDAFATTSTQPVVASIQEIPPSNQGTKIVDTLPAMKDFPMSKLDDIQKQKGKAKQEIEVQGVLIPPKPIPPGEEDDLEIYNNAVEAAKEALNKVGVPPAEWPEDVRDKQSGEVVKEQVAQDVDPVMSAFLALENKLKKKT